MNRIPLVRPVAEVYQGVLEGLPALLAVDDVPDFSVISKLEDDADFLNDLLVQVIDKNSEQNGSENAALWHTRLDM